MSAQVIVLAKTPVPGRVKTRLCPPWTPSQAARLATASLFDTLDVVASVPVRRRVLVVEGDLAAPSGWSRVRQRGAGLGERIACAFADTALPGVATVLVGMDTPQITPALLERAIGQVVGDPAGAVLGPAEDGGWWLLGLRHPGDARVLRDVPTSTCETALLTVAALTGIGRKPLQFDSLRDVDTAADALAVAALCAPGSRFAATVDVLA